MVNKPLVGIVGPFTGPRACYGDLLAETIHATDLEKYAHCIFEDDKASADFGERAAKQLSEKKVLSVIGHFNSLSAMAAGRIYAKVNIPLLLPASTLPNLTNIKTSFRLCPNDLDQALAIVNCMKKKSFNKAAIWVDGSSYSLSLRELILKKAQLCDFEWTQSDKIAKNDIIILLGAHHTITDFILEKGNKLKETQVICCDDCSIEEFKQAINNSIKVQIAKPFPSFEECIKKSAELVIEFLKTNLNLSFLQWLLNYNFFSNQENKLAKFNIE